MGLLKALLGRVVPTASILSAVGAYAAGRVFGRIREKWQKAGTPDTDALLDHITANDVAAGAGKLLKGWLLYEESDLTVARAEGILKKLLLEMDKKDETPFDQARSRVLASKALFYIEGFKLSHCRYEVLQKEAQTLLRKHPDWHEVSRLQVFQAVPFAPEEIIGTAHRMLILLGGKKLWSYMETYLSSDTRLRDDADYMARLIALTLDEEQDLRESMDRWFEEYRLFKIAQADRQEAAVNTSINAVTGGLPTQLGLDLLTRVFRRATHHKSS